MGDDKTPKIAKFIRRLFTIVTDDSFPEIQWTDDGLRFYILDKKQFMNNGLKFISKTTEFSAFVRLLYVYGFSKSKSINAFDEEFYHRNFQRNGEQMLPCIKRSVETKTTILAKNTNKTPNQLQDLLQYLNGQNFKLENEVRILKERVDKQDCTINGLVEVLSRLFRNNDANSTSNNISPFNSNSSNINSSSNINFSTNYNTPSNNRELEMYLQRYPQQDPPALIPQIDLFQNNMNNESNATLNKNVLFESDDEDSLYETEYF